jgi:colicin import membrane protein
MSQASSSQKLPDPDSVEWHLTNEQRLIATDIRRERVGDLEQTLQIPNQQRVELELQRGQGDVLNYKEGIRELDRQARQRWLDDAARRQTEKLAAVDKLQREKTQQRALREKVRAGDRQRKLDEDAAKRAEARRVKEQQEAERGERSRLNSLAIVQQTQEIWRLRDEARATKQLGQKALRDEAGMKAGGQFKRPASTQEAIDPSPKRTLGQLDGRRSRYVSLV